MPILNGTYTIENTKTSEHRTFSIRTSPPDAKFAPGKRVVALLTGPDNVTSYSGFGFLRDGKVEVWRSKRGASKPSAYDAYAVMLAGLCTEGEGSRWFKAGYRLMASCTCIVCNRKLTTPESLAAGIGPECAAKNGVARSGRSVAHEVADTLLEEMSRGDEAASVAEPVTVSALPREYDLWGAPSLRSASR